MYSSRRYSVQRHIDNIHKGIGVAIPFVEYLVGRRNGWYPPRQTPFSGISIGRSFREKMEEEAEQVCLRRIVESCLPPSGDPLYDQYAGALMSSIMKRISEPDQK